MPLPPLRHDSIAGEVDVLRNSRSSNGSPRPLAARPPRAPACENPFASFYESRRKLSVDDGTRETSDLSSSITRAYIVPEALLALARGEQAAASPGPVDAIASRGPGGGARGPEAGSFATMAATARRGVATESTSMFRFRSPSASLAADWRSVQHLALSMVGWLRRAWRGSAPN